MTRRLFIIFSAGYIVILGVGEVKLWYPIFRSRQPLAHRITQHCFSPRVAGAVVAAQWAQMHGSTMQPHEKAKCRLWTKRRPPAKATRVLSIELQSSRHSALSAARSATLIAGHAATAPSRGRAPCARLHAGQSSSSGRPPRPARTDHARIRSRTRHLGQTMTRGAVVPGGARQGPAGGGAKRRGNRLHNRPPA
jgi:hypothetical protein